MGRIRTPSVLVWVTIGLVTFFIGGVAFGGTSKSVPDARTSKSAKVLRLIVSYKYSLTPAERKKIHQPFGGKLRKHFSSINSDLVVFDLDKNAASENSMEHLCELYLRQASVRSCEPDRKIKFPFQEVCNPTYSTNSNVAAAIPQIVQQTLDKHCEVVPSQGLTSAQAPDRQGLDGMWKVSPLWGQQVVGADLAAEFVSKRLQSGAASRVLTGNMDIISDRTPASPVHPDAIKLDLIPAGDRPLHGDQTADLVGSPLFGVSPAVSWSAIVNLAARQDNGNAHEAWNSNLIAGLEAIGRTQTRLVTASIGYYGASPRAAIDSFVGRGRMFIKSSGNDYPVASWSGSAPHVGHIIVGSVGPNGIQTPFSQEPAKIYAPADGSQLSGSNDRFGGTSGATPLVTGSIVNALAIHPHLSNSAIEDLLSRTSLPSFSQKALGYGPGLLNSYRMAVVAACLVDASANQSQTSINPADGTCFDQGPKARDFRNEADRLLRSSSCVNQRDGLKALRASFLLQPSRDTALRIAEIYERLGFPGDARWYRTAAATLGTTEQQHRHFDDLLSEPSLTNHRYFAGSTVGEKSRGFYALSLASRIPSNSPYVQTTLERISSLARSSDSSNQERAIQQALIVGPRALPAISNLLIDSDDYQNPRSAKRVISKLTMYDGVRHSWIDETRVFFRGTPFEKHLPAQRPSGHQ